MMAVQPLVAAQEIAGDDLPDGGMLTVVLTDDASIVLSGGCFAVTDAQGITHTGCDDGSGSATFMNLPIGEATISLTTAHEGYGPAAAVTALVLEGNLVSATLVAPVIPQAPLPTTEPPLEQAPETEEPVTDSPQADAGSQVSIMAVPGNPSVTCAPLGDGISRVSLIIPVTDGPLDSAPDVQYLTTDRFGNQAGPVTFGQMTWESGSSRYVAVVPSYTFAEIDWQFDLHLGAGWQQINGGGCAYFPPLDLGIDTMAKDTAGTDLPDGAQVASGTSFYDTAVFEGPGAEFASELAGETVYYRLYKNNASCAGTPVREFSVTVNADGSIPDSPVVNPDDADLGDGIYDWQVYYPGDGQDGNFNPATSICGWETIVVGQNDTGISTIMKRAGGATIGHRSSVPLGTTVYDTTQLSAVSANASGTVTYTLYLGACGSDQTIVSGPHEVTVTGGVVPDSPTFTPVEQGVYNWVVEYSGDTQNNGATSECGAETFTVVQARPDITTAMFQADDTPIAQGTAISRNTGVYDTTTISGFYVPEGGQLGGTITYTLYRGANCNGGIVGEAMTFPVEGVGAGNRLPDSGVLIADAVGTYNWVVTYSGDDYNAEATSGCGEETFRVEQNRPTINTQPQLVPAEGEPTDIALDGVVSAPADVRDTAALAGATDNAGGTVTYVLFEGACGNLTEVDSFGPYTVENGIVPASDVAEALEPGQYNWIAYYSGDGDNARSESPCGEEQFFVTAEGVGGYVHTQVQTDAGVDVPNRGKVPLGTAVIDTAQFYGDIVNEDGTAAAGGELVYTLYQGEGCSDEVRSWTYAVSAGQEVPAIPAADAERLEEAGEYNFQAVFTPAGGEPISSPCGTEAVIVEPIAPTLTTTMYGGTPHVEIGHRSRLTRPNVVSDGVTFKYGFDEAYMEGLPKPNGTLEYRLYNSANCSGNPVFTDSSKTVTEGVAENSGQATLDESAFGTYNWVVVFTSTDDNYESATSPCRSETFYLDAQPTLTTTMFQSDNGEGSGESLTDGGTVTVGDYVRDTATLSGATPNASGTVTFTLYQGLGCNGVVMFQDTTSVTNGVVEPTDWYQVRLFGDYSWRAVYSGNTTSGGFNKSVDHCLNETFTARMADVTPTMETVMYKGDSVIPHQSYIFGPATVSDQAIFTNLSTDISGTITYTLYSGQGATCGDLTEVQSWEVGVANGIAERSGQYTIDDVEFGGEVYSWGVVFVSDDEEISVESGCANEQFRIYGPNTLHGVVVECTYNQDDRTMSFDLTMNPRPVGDEATNVQSRITMSAYDLYLAPVGSIDPIENEWDVAFDHMPWRQVRGAATWSTGESATFIVRCNTQPLEPELTTTMYQVTDDGDVVMPHGESTLAPGAVVYDTTQIAEETSTITMSGTLTYQLFRGDDCAVEVSSQVITLNNTAYDELPNANPVTVTVPGTYNWVVTYAPPANDSYPDNSRTVSPCGSETFQVQTFDTTLTTLIVTENGSSTAAATGEDVYDTATLTASPDIETSVVPTGTVTYYAYAGEGSEACTGEPVWSSAALSLNANGTFPSSGVTQFMTAGQYEYQAVYSGDANYDPATSACGSEPLTITAPTLTIVKTSDSETVNAGEDVGFTVTVTNPGLGVATGVTLTDELPVTTGVEWTIASGSNETCAEGENGVVTCGPVDLDAEQTLVLRITGTTTGETCDDVVNEASFASTNANSGDDEATVTVLCPDVVAAKTAGADAVSAGDTITFTMTITNNGPGEAFDATLTDTLPADTGLSWTIDPEVEGCAIVDGVLTCDFGTLASGASESVTITSMTTAETCGPVENTVRASASNEPAGKDDDANEASDSVTVNCPDVTLEKSTTTPVVNATDAVSFTIAMSNIGLGTAYDVEMEDALPAGLTWSMVGTVEGCEIVTNGDSGQQVLTCAFEQLAPGAGPSVTVTATTSFETCGVYENVASISAGNESTANAENNEDDASVEVQCSNVELTKVADADTISAGDEIGFTISMTNSGQGTAYNAVLTDTLPAKAGLAWTIEPGVEGCTIDEESGVLTCEAGDLAADATFSVRVVSQTTAETCDTVSNDAVVRFDNAPDEEADDSVTVLCPDVSILKTAVQGTINATDTASFQIVVSNAGPGTAYDVVVTDELPDGISDWAVDHDGCAVEEGVLTCEFAEMAPAATHTITVSAPTTLEMCGPHPNTATVGASNEPEENVDEGNESTATISVNCSDVTLTKVADDEEISAGDRIGFTITMVNGGEGVAYDAVLTDTLPTNAGLAWEIDPEVEGCTIDEETGVLTCEIGDLAEDGEFSVHITSVTTAATCGVVDNSAMVEFREGNTEPANASDQVTVLCPTPQITKVADNGMVSAGDEVGFTITASNAGPGNAYDVVLTDTLPTTAGTVWTIAGGEGAEFCAITDEGVLECDFGTMAPESSWEVRLVSPTTYASCSVISNTVEMSLSNGDPVDDGDAITVLCPDPVLLKVADEATVSAGDEIGFTITITNDGEGNAYGVSIADTLPEAPGTAWTIDGGTGADSCAIEDGVLTCEFGTMAEGESLSVHISSPTSAATCGVVNNTAVVTLTNAPTEEAGDSVTVNCPNPVIVKVADEEVVNAGDAIGFTISVTNDGLGNAYDVVVTDTLPATPGTAWSIVGGTGAEFCAIEEGVLHCDVGTMAPDAQIDVRIASPTTAASCSVIDNTASVSAGNESDETIGDNTSSAAVTVNCSDVMIEKVADAGTVSAGDPIGFTITVTNTGEGDAYEVVLTDELVAVPGLAWTIGGAGAESCVIEDGVLTCIFGTLDAGTSIAVRVTSPTTAQSCGVIDNTAIVSASNEPGDATEDNTSSDSVTVNCPDVSIVKTAAGELVRTGETAGFTMTIANHGVGTAYDIVVTDKLPAGFAWTVAGDVESCAIVDGVLTCEIAELAPGASVTITVSATAGAEVCGPVENTASVSAGNEPEDVTGDNASSASLTVQCPDPAKPSTPSTPDGPPVVTHLPDTGSDGSAGVAPMAGMLILGAVMLAGAGWYLQRREAA